jgi:hypothetical protein
MNLLYIINAKLKDNLHFRIILVFCSILLIVLREPALFLAPRLWAEEGFIFYSFALHHSVWGIFTTAHVGYLILFNSIVSSLQAKIFSVENAATVSTYFGFLVQLIPIYIIAFTTSKLWDNPVKKIFCVFIIIVMAPELWLNTTNSHFIFGLITFLIIVISGTALSRFQKYFFRVLLLIGGLTGPASIFFTPTFLLKAYREKSKEKYMQAGILTVCVFIQAFIIMYSIFFNNTYKRLAVHNLSTSRYHFIIDNFSLLPHSSHFSYQLFSFDVITLFGVLIGCLYIYLLFENRKKNEYLIPLLSFMVVAVFFTLGSLDMAGGARYGYIPTCILLIIIVSKAFQSGFNRIKYIVLPLFTICLLANAIWYRPVIHEWMYSSTAPKWKGEVANWRADSAYIPKTHPDSTRIDNWPVKL